MIFHITKFKDWEKAKLEGKYTASSLDSEGFIHCSTQKQVIDTANIFFKGQTELFFLCIDENKLIPEIKFESPNGNNHQEPIASYLFPHIYGPINLSAVIKVINFPSNEDGTFSLPKEIISLL